MSIATELTNLNNNILDAYDAVQDKGGTVPAHKNMANLDTAINSIPGSNPYAIGRTIGSSGPYSNQLQIPHPTSITVPADIDSIGPYAYAYAYSGYYNSDAQLLADIDLSNVKHVGDGGMEHFAYYGTNVSGTSSTTGVSTQSTFSAPELAVVAPNGFEFAFANHNFASVNFPKLATVNSYAFKYAFAVQKYANGTTFSFPALEQLGAGTTYAFQGCFAMQISNTTKITTCGPASISFSALTTIDAPNVFSMAFRGCGLLTSVNFPALATIGASATTAFDAAFIASGITSIPFTALTTISAQSVFQNAFSSSSLTTVVFPALAAVNSSSVFYSAFTNCPDLVSVSFPVLSEIKGSKTFTQAFASCSSLISVSFPALTADSFGSYINQFNNMLRNCSNVTVHFSASAQAKVETMTGYPDFGGTNTTVLFDL